MLIFFYYQHKQHELKGVTIIKSSSSTRKGDPLKGLLFALTHYQTFLKPLHKPQNCVFPSLKSNTHIAGPMNEIVLTFDHLLT